MTKPRKMVSTIVLTVLFLNLLVLWLVWFQALLPHLNDLGWQISFEDPRLPVWVAVSVLGVLMAGWWVIPFAGFAWVIAEIWKRPF